jgi:hypothetical protein
VNLVVGQTYRYPRPADPGAGEVDGLPNFFHVTEAVGHPRLQLERGIFSPTATEYGGTGRLPLVLIRSSPNKPSSKRMPWIDHFDLDAGRVFYYGDNKADGPGAELAGGNADLLWQAELHLSPEVGQRQLAAPILVFRSVTVDGRMKGNVRLEGLAVIESVEKVVQTDLVGKPYGNYRFRLRLLDLAGDHSAISNDWLIDRRSRDVPHEDANGRAPAAWKAWTDGELVGDSRVSSLERSSGSSEDAAFGPPHQTVLDALEVRYRQYQDRFVHVAIGLVEYLFGVSGVDYRTTALDVERGRFEGEVSVPFTDIGHPTRVHGVVDLTNRPIRLSQGYLDGHFAEVDGDLMPLFVTREVVPLGHRDEVRSHVLDGRRIAQLLEDLRVGRGLTVDSLLDHLETDASSIIRPAIAGQAGSRAEADISSPTGPSYG